MVEHVKCITNVTKKAGHFKIFPNFYLVQNYVIYYNDRTDASADYVVRIWFQKTFLPTAFDDVYGNGVVYDDNVGNEDDNGDDDYDSFCADKNSDDETENDIGENSNNINLPTSDEGPISLVESFLSILTFMTQDKISSVLLTDIIKIIRFHFPGYNIFRKLFY